MQLVTGPWSEPTAFTVIVSSRQEQFWTDQKYLLVQAQHTTVVKCVLEVYWHSNVTEDITSEFFVGQDFFNRVPAVFDGVLLKEVVFTAVAANFKLRSKSVGGAATLSFFNRADDVLLVVLKGHSPLVKLADSNHRILFVHSALLIFLS